jgi:DNA-binding response OmpR family regulator
MSIKVRDMGRVLLIEDDVDIRLALVRALTEDGYIVRSAGNAMTGLRELTAWEPDIVVLDLGLPDLDGGTTLRMIRAVSNVPVIIATARNVEHEIVTHLNAGADDYVTKPYSAEQLSARIGALLRRTGTAPQATTLQVGGLMLDLDARDASLDGVALQLSRREFDLLAYLAASPGRVVTRRELLAKVWHQAYGGDYQTIDVHVSWLRRKLGEPASDPRYLHTVRGIGVKLVVPA